MKFKPPFSVLKKKYSNQEENLIEFLSENYLFADLEHKEIAEFLPFLHQRYYTRDEVIFFRGDPGQALYLIKKGRVALYMDINDKFEELTRMKSTDSFGDNAILPNTRRFYNAVSNADMSEIYVIPHTNIQEIFDADVKIKAKLMKAMAVNYYEHMTRLFRSYKDSFGFFDLSRAFVKR